MFLFTVCVCACVCVFMCLCVIILGTERSVMMEEQTFNDLDPIFAPKLSKDIEIKDEEEEVRPASANS